MTDPCSFCHATGFVGTSRCAECVGTGAAEQEWDAFLCVLVPKKTPVRYQAKDVPEDVPELKAFPVKVLVAKLNSMARRGLIGGGGTYDMRGDWHVDGRK